MYFDVLRSAWPLALAHGCEPPVVDGRGMVRGAHGTCGVGKAGRAVPDCDGCCPQ